jgi:hypothetical protein
MSLSTEEKHWISDLELNGEVYLGAANETAFYDQDSGTVETNIQGLNRYLYASLEDFIEHALEGNFVPHQHSVYIGSREEIVGGDDIIEFNDNYDPEHMTIDDDEDGSSMYSSFVKVTS